MEDPTERLISRLTSPRPPRSLAELRLRVEALRAERPLEAPRAAVLAGYAHLACANLDGRALPHAAALFAEGQAFEPLGQVLRIARRYGNVAAVEAVHRVGLACGRPELQVPDLAPWLRAEGALWLDILHDPEGGVSFIPDEEVERLRRLGGPEPGEPEAWEAILAAAARDPRVSGTRRALLARLAGGHPPVVRTPPGATQDLVALVQAAGRGAGIRWLRRMQAGRSGIRRCSEVWLGLDPGGSACVYKELLDYSRSRRGPDFSDEEAIYGELRPGGPLPRLHGSLEVAGRGRFLRLGLIHGRPLTDFLGGEPLAPEEAYWLALRLAEAIERLHADSVAHLDLKPENMLVDGERVLLADLGVSNTTAGPRRARDIYLADPRYGTPECGRELRAYPASDIYQLGVLAFELLTGQHPFALDTSALPAPEAPDPEAREQQILSHLWPGMVRPLRLPARATASGARFALVARMLERDPALRPDIAEVVDGLARGPLRPPGPGRPRRRRCPEQGETVLFPARMGIPHAGHIEFITRLLQLGFHVIVSLQRTYTLTERDPIAKWIVAKMVARSLLDRGFSLEDFTVRYCPYYRTRDELRLHFAMMPGMERVVAVASGNPGFEGLLGRLPLLSQAALFGTPGEPYASRSWGEDLRRAIRQGRYPDFVRLAATGVERLMTFAEVREACAPLPRPIPFVPGKVRLRLLDPGGAQVAAGRPLRHRSPEESLARHLSQALDRPVELLDPVARDTPLDVGGEPWLMRYQGCELTGAGDLVVTYICVPGAGGTRSPSRGLSGLFADGR